MRVCGDIYEIVKKLIERITVQETWLLSVGGGGGGGGSAQPPSL